MPTYPLATLSPTVSSTGISAPQYSDILASLQASFKAIYGSDIYIEPDSQDGQFLAVMAAAINDSNNAMIAVFQGFSPSYAQGAGLSAAVKINGLIRNSASNSTAIGTVTGTVGTVIQYGVVSDTNNNLWNMPPSVTIPISGSITVTVTAQNPGSIIALAGTINQMNNPQLGWQSFVNTADATPGAAIETDAQLRARQSVSTAIAAYGIKEALYAAIGQLAGVGRYTIYENATGAPDGNGLPAYSIAVVVEGGNANAIAQAIYSKKPIGTPTAGSTQVVVSDQYGLQTPINFYALAETQIYFGITIKALAGYQSSTAVAIQNAIMAFINSLAIGEDVYPSQAQAVASLANSPLGQTFYITAFTLGLAALPVGTAIIVIPFNAAANMALASQSAITVT